MKLRRKMASERVYGHTCTFHSSMSSTQCRQLHCHGALHVVSRED